MKESEIAERARIKEVIDLYYHVVDEEDVSGLSRIFSEDCTIDITAFGGDVVTGIDDIIARFNCPPPRLVLAHMGTNTRIELEGEEARGVTKCIAMLEGGRVGVAIHNDWLRRTPDGWRIYKRVVEMPAQLAAAD